MSAEHSSFLVSRRLLFTTDREVSVATGLLLLHVFCVLRSNTENGNFKGDKHNVGEDYIRI